MAPDELRIHLSPVAIKNKDFEALSQTLTSMGATPNTLAKIAYETSKAAADLNQKNRGRFALLAHTYICYTSHVGFVFSSR